MPYKWKEDKAAYQKKYHAKWYKKNKEKVNKRKRDNMEEKKKWWVEYKSTLSCKKCGVSHPAILDFHHRNQTEKEDKDDILSRIVHNNCSKERILQEVTKCDVLCANCHRIYHWDRRKEMGPPGVEPG